MKKHVLSALAMVTFAAAAAAGTVTLENGDRITGDLVKVDGGKMTVATKHMCDVVIDMAGIAAFTSDDQVAAKLRTGDTVVGRVTSAGGGRVTFTSESGSYEVAVADVRALRAAGGISAGPHAAQAVEELFTGPETSPWSGALEFGGTYTSGNTDRRGLTSSLTVTRDTADDKFTAKAYSLYAEENGERTTNEKGLWMREDVKFNPWYVFALLSFEKDEFEDLELRGIFAPGLGYWIADTDDFKARVEVGPTLTYVDYDRDYYFPDEDESGEYRAEARVGAHVDWRIFKETLFYADLQYFPTRGGECRLISDTGFSQPLSESIFFKFAAINEYNSELQNPSKNHDLKIITALVFKF